MPQIDRREVRHTFFSLGNQVLRSQYCSESLAKNFVREKWGGYDHWDEGEPAISQTSVSLSSEDGCCRHMIPLTTDNSLNSCEFCQGQRLLEEAARSNARIAKGNDPSCYHMKFESPETHLSGSIQTGTCNNLPRNNQKATKQSQWLSITGGDIEPREVGPAVSHIKLSAYRTQN